MLVSCFKDWLHLNPYCLWAAITRYIHVAKVLRVSLYAWIIFFGSFRPLMYALNRLSQHIISAANAHFCSSLLRRSRAHIHCHHYRVVFHRKQLCGGVWTNKWTKAQEEVSLRMFHKFRTSIQQLNENSQLQAILKLLKTNPYLITFFEQISTFFYKNVFCAVRKMLRFLQFEFTSFSCLTWNCSNFLILQSVSLPH